MRTWLKWMFAATLLLLGGGGLLLAFHLGWIGIGRSSTDPVVEEINGQVGLRCGKEQYAMLARRTAIKQTDCSVATGPLSRAVIRLPRHAAMFDLRELSELRIQVSPQGAPKFVAELTRGIVHAVDETHLGTYSIRTPSAAIGIRGTEFMLKHELLGTRTTVWLRQGSVDVTPANKALTPVTLQPGQKVEVTPDSISPVTVEAAPALPTYKEGITPPPKPGERSRIGGTWSGTCTTVKVVPDNPYSLGQVKQITNFVVSDFKIHREFPTTTADGPIVSTLDVTDDHFKSETRTNFGVTGFEFQLAGVQLVGKYYSQGSNYYLEDRCELSKVAK